jgi:osmotically inducible lipoprotein OsmB
MRKLLAIGLLAMPLSACMDNDIQRGLLGAGAGAALTHVTGGNLYAGAVLGGLFGTICDDVNVCGKRY